MSLRQRKKDKTRSALQETALALFSEKGFADTTINEIAAVVDISPRTLLRYFQTKEDIVASCVEDSMAVFLSSLEARSQEEPAHVALLASARALLTKYQSEARFYLAVERVIAASPTVRARKLDMTADLASRVAGLLQQRKADAAADEWPPILYPDLVFSIIRTVINRWVERDGEGSLVALFDEASGLINFAD